MKFLYLILFFFLLNQSPRYVPAHYPGGKRAYDRFIFDSTRIKNMDGTVFVCMDLTNTGRISNVRVARGFDKACNEEALRLIRSVSWWVPARLDNSYQSGTVVVLVQFENYEERKKRKGEEFDAIGEGVGDLIEAVIDAIDD